jgi:sugar phosphate isomerase/epimerase
MLDVHLGLLTAAFPDEPLTAVADWAASAGFSSLEVACWPPPEGPSRRYAGVCHLDVTALDEDAAKHLTDDLAERGLSISSLGYYPNPLHPEPEHRAAVHEHLKAVIRAAALTGVNLVTTFAGADQTVPQRVNLDRFAELWPPLVAYAKEHGVRIAIENCPMIFSDDEWPSGQNLAYNPYAWRAMFEAVDGDPTLGLNLDPSHLVWQMIDVDRVVREFGDRIYHVHAKDLQIDPEGLYQHGVMSLGMGWQVPRLTGLGDVDWRRFISALYRVGYDGALCIEHEDRGFEGTPELVRRGFLLARDHVRPLVR